MSDKEDATRDELANLRGIISGLQEDSAAKTSENVELRQRNIELVRKPALMVCPHAAPPNPSPPRKIEPDETGPCPECESWSNCSHSFRSVESFLASNNVCSSFKPRKQELSPDCCFVCKWYVEDKNGKFDKCSGSGYNHISKDFCCSMFSLHPTLEPRKKPIELVDFSVWPKSLALQVSSLALKLNELIAVVNDG